LIEGEAGIGKTRLISDLVNKTKESNVQYLRGRCRFHHGLDPYSPFIEALRNWFGLSEELSYKKEKSKIGQIIRTASPELIGIIPLIRGFLSAGTSIYGSYLFKGSNIEKSFRTFKELTIENRNGLLISRTHPDEIMEKYDLKNTKMYWLTKSLTDSPSLEPSQIEKIRWVIKDFVSENKASVILLDGLEYLILQNNFENVLKFVELLKDDIALSDSILILPIDPATLEERQLALLERYMRVISSETSEFAMAKKIHNAVGISIPDYREKEYPIRPIEMDYAAEKDKMFEAILQLFKNMTTKKTLILFIDDLHWADYSSIQLLQYLFQNIIDNKILIIASYRPEDIPEGEDFIQDMIRNIKNLKYQDRVHKIKLNRLNKPDSGKIINDILDSDVPNKFANLIFEKSEGNPLYIEEILKSLLEDHIIDLENKEWLNKFEMSKIEIPNTITEVIKMRLDRVTKGNDIRDQILKYTSIIGSIFNFDILLEAMKIDEELLLDNLERLMRANTIHEVNEDQYKFDHTVIREVIYGGLSSRRKKILHARIGYIIEKLNKDNLVEHYAELANHFSKGGVIEKAVFYSKKEGEIAKDICAYDEALFHYRAALEMIMQEKSFKTKKNELINIYINLGDLSLILGAWTEAKTYFEKSLEISKEFGDDVKKVESRSKLGQIEIKKQKWSLAIEKLEEVLDLKLDKKDRNVLLVNIQPKFIIRANITLIDILLNEGLKGIYICINHPSHLIDKVLKKHQLSTNNLLYLDFFTSITGVPPEINENVFVIDNAFSLDGILDAMDLGVIDSDKIPNFDLKSIDFIMVDNISNLITYTTPEKIEQFIQDLIDNIMKLTAVYGIVISDNQTNPKIQKMIELYFDKTVTIKEEWL
jgi:predicted ATPase